MDFNIDVWIPMIKKSIQLMKLTIATVSTNTTTTFATTAAKSDEEQKICNHVCQPTRLIYDWDKLIGQMKRCDGCKYQWNEYFRLKNQLNLNESTRQSKHSFMYDTEFYFQVKDSFLNHTHITFLVKQASINLHSIWLDGNLLSSSMSTALIRHCPNLIEIRFGRVRSPFFGSNRKGIQKLLKYFGPQLKAFEWKELNCCFIPERISMMIEHLDPKKITSLGFSIYKSEQLEQMSSHFCHRTSFSFSKMIFPKLASKDWGSLIEYLERFPKRSLELHTINNSGDAFADKDDGDDADKGDKGRKEANYDYLKHEQVVSSLKCLIFPAHVNFPKHQYKHLRKLSRLEELDFRVVDKPLIQFVGNHLWYLRMLNLKMSIDQFVELNKYITSISLLELLRLELHTLDQSELTQKSINQLSRFNILREFVVIVQCATKQSSGLMSLLINQLLPPMMPKLKTLSIKCHNLPMEDIVQLPKKMPTLVKIKLSTNKIAVKQFNKLSHLVPQEVHCLAYQCCKKDE